MKFNHVADRVDRRHFESIVEMLKTQLGLPAKVAQGRMGHSPITLTFDTYGHLFRFKDEAKALEGRGCAARRGVSAAKMRQREDGEAGK